jgi:protease-4
MPAIPSNARTLLIAGGIVIVAMFLVWAIVPARGYASCSVAYIPVHGELVTYVPASESTTTGDAYDQTASEDVTRSIRTADADPEIKGIVLEIDSPGGSPVAGEEIQAALKQSSKPTVALIRDEGDSAAYLAASGADAIFASAFSDVGDIGITQSYVDSSKQDAENGLTFNQLSVGKYKDMFNTDKPLTPDERALAMKELQIDYNVFVDIVAENRGMSTDTALSLSDGSSFTGQEAVQNGLIDRIGNIDDVRAYLSDKLGANAVICGIDSN